MGLNLPVLLRQCRLKVGISREFSASLGSGVLFFRRSHLAIGKSLAARLTVQVTPQTILGWAAGAAPGPEAAPGLGAAPQSGKGFRVSALRVPGCHHAPCALSPHS